MPVAARHKKGLDSLILGSSRKINNFEQHLVKKLLSQDGPPSNYQEYRVLTFFTKEQTHEERRIASH
jgi:hypothetical protein